MRLIIATLATMLMASPVLAEDNFVQGIWGPTWFQSDSNSNHYAFAEGLEFGHKYKSPINVVVGYLQSENSDEGVSESQVPGVSSNSDEQVYLQSAQQVEGGRGINYGLQTLSYDFEFKAFTIWAMPRVDFGRFSFSAGPGIGAVYSKLDITLADGRQASNNYWQDNYSLRADLHYAVTDNLGVGFTYRHDYFEVELNDRKVSDYEVNQDRVYYLANVRWTF